MTEELLSAMAAAQRRAHVRVAISGPMSLEVPDDEGDTFSTHKGVLVDLSEGAARCALWVERAVTRRLAQGCPVVLNFTLRNHDFHVPGQARLRSRNRGDGMIELIVEFDRPDVHAKTLRRELFAEQIRQSHMTKLS
jgi:hypothetical protein